MVLSCSFIFSVALIVAAWPIPSYGKHIAVIGGMMKSHHISCVPLIEGLLGRGHEVSFLMPNTSEAKLYFPNGIGNSKMVYLGTEDWSFDTIFSGDDIDLKNQPWHQKVYTFAKLLWSYRDVMEKPLFSMYQELVEWLKQPGIDAILLHVASFGYVPLAEASGIPVVGYLSIPATPLILVHDKDEVCRYPNMLAPPRVDELKSSLIARVSNHMQCRFLQGYMKIADHEFEALFSKKGLTIPRGSLLEMMSGVPNSIIFGGPPLGPKIPLSPGMHLVGSVEKSKPSPIPSGMLSWLDAAKDAGAPIMYISLGTKYELTETTCTELVDILYEMIAKLGLRILWSLRASQQEKLASLLPDQGVSLRIETFTPQPEVLQHAGVKIFLSHCGWGGVMDAIQASVPVLAFPGMAEQFLNARGLEEAGAGILLNVDFSNLLASTTAMLADQQRYAGASRAAGETLQSYGGLARALDIVEAAAGGQYLTPDAGLQAMMSDVDPFFKSPQVMEQWISLGLFSALFLVIVLVPCWCCRCLCRCCCGRRKSSKAEGAKKRQ